MTIYCDFELTVFNSCVAKDTTGKEAETDHMVIHFFVMSCINCYSFWHGLRTRLHTKWLLCTDTCKYIFKYKSKRFNQWIPKGT